MRDSIPPLTPASAARLLALPLVALGLIGCGPSQLAREYDAYKVRVEPVLEQEGDRWNGLAKLLQERQDDLASPRYFDYLQQTALPFYTEMLGQLTAVVPEGERVAEAHRELVRFAEARLAFVHVEMSARDVFEAMTADEGLLDVFSGLAEAENLRYEYQEKIGEGVPDAKLGELYTLVDTFRRRYFDPMQQGAMDPEEVQVRLRSHVIPTLEALQRRKYDDDDQGRLLKACVSSWLQWHRRLERACPTLQTVWQIKARSEAAAKEADEALAAWRKKLEEIRRDR